MALAVRAVDAELTPSGPEPDRVLAGNPVSSDLVLASDEKVSYGIWQITPGTSVQIAPTGMFVVLSGRATIAVEGGSTFGIGPGDVCIWDGGERTIWTVYETVRKVWCQVQMTARDSAAAASA
jgi:uncharacterized cupin superfamily protein